MELVPKNEVFDTDKRNTKKMLLPTDAVCVQCGIIFNAFYSESCVLCDDEESPKKGEGIIREEIIKIIKEEERDNICEHKEFIFGRQSVDLRVILDYNIEDLRALCELHGCPEGGSRAKMTINILKKLHPTLDKRINETLIRKMLFRNRKKFRYWRDIESAVRKAKKIEKIKLVDAEECIEIKDMKDMSSLQTKTSKTSKASSNV